MPNEEEYVCAYVLIFAEGGAEGNVLHRGDKESCEKVSTAIPGVNYKGDRTVLEAQMLVVPASEWESMTQGG